MTSAFVDGAGAGLAGAELAGAAGLFAVELAVAARLLVVELPAIAESAMEPVMLALVAVGLMVAAESAGLLFAGVVPVLLVPVGVVLAVLAPAVAEESELGRTLYVATAAAGEECLAGADERIVVTRK